MEKTIIIQGIITSTTASSVRSFRELSEARIIVSTWEGQNTKSFEYDIRGVTNCEVLYLKDPGEGPIQNFNRQLVGTNEALKLVSDGIVLKTRSDAIHHKNPFDFYEKTPASNPDFTVVKNKIWVSNVMSCTPEFRMFSPSDWIFMGEHDDVKEWFSISAQAEICKNYARCCEQIFCLSNFAKCQASDGFDFINCFDQKNKQLSLDFLNENLHFVGTRGLFGAIVGRYPNHHDQHRFWMKPQKEKQ